MLNRNIILKSWGYLPYLTPQRLKVRILPRIYDDYETPYMKSRKPGVSFITNFYAIVNRKWKWADIKNYFMWKRMNEICEDQKYVSERHKTLGPDLATAHFVVARRGKVKFHGQTEWMTFEHLKNDKIPSCYVPGFLVEEIDVSGMLICYEGLENMCSLNGLKKLILRGCPLIDDWCLSRMYLFQDSLEYLDISGCVNVSERGICTLYVLKRLKTLVMHDTTNVQNKELVCLLLQDHLPNCEVLGVDFNNPILLKRVEKYIS